MTAHDIGPNVTLDVPDGAPRTIETHSSGGPPVHRFFLEMIVIAASVHAGSGDAVDDVATASGSLISAYRDRRNYARTPSPDPSIEAATEASVLRFTWDDDEGVPMTSVAIVASDGLRTAVVHGAYPSIHDVDGATGALALEAVSRVRFVREP